MKHKTMKCAGFERICERAKGMYQKHPLLIALSYALFYFPMFLYLEHRTVEGFHVVHCALDDLLPFLPGFVIPYLMWFLLLPGALVYFLKREPERYYELCWLLFAGMTVCLLLYICFPNRIFLRRPLLGDGALIWVIRLIRSIDTPTNVCPSIHVASTVAVMLVVHRAETLRQYRWVRYGVYLLGAAICLSTMFLDQHSAIDVVCGVALTLLLRDVMLLWRRRNGVPSTVRLASNR